MELNAMILVFLMLSFFAKLNIIHVKLRSNGTVSEKLHMIITQPSIPNQIPIPLNSNSTLHILVTRTAQKTNTKLRRHLLNIS